MITTDTLHPACPSPILRKASFFVFLLCLCTQQLRAQRYAPIDWDTFAAEYFGREDENAEGDAIYWQLEELAEHPLNLNTATREDLLQLPFLPASAADSILSRRTHAGPYSSVGELAFVNGLDYDLRRYLALFVTTGPAQRERPSLRDMLLSGRSEAEGRMDIPLYRRAGDRSLEPGEHLSGNNAVFLGQPVGGVVRYRYRWRQNVKYGFTLQQDAGEPFAARHNYPFDHASVYAWMRTPDDKTDILVGDYRTQWGQGLTMGHTFLTSRSSLLDAPRRTGQVFTPHTSAEENNFLRGIALRYRLGTWRLTAFGSFRTLDARMDGDTVRTLLTTGLHRTDVEYARKDATSLALGGTHIETGGDGWDAGVGMYYGRYGDPISPDARAYNKYYLHGRDIAALSAHWNLAHWRHWTWVGEVAADRMFHLALTNTIQFSPQDELTLILQHRDISPRFVAPMGRAYQAASRVANEHGLMLGARYSGWKNISLRGYADLFYFPEATYYADKASRGMELLGEASLRASAECRLTLRYKMTSRQRNVSGTDLLDYNYRHRLRLQADWQHATWDLHATLDGTLAGRQTNTDKYGWLAALRSAWHPSPRWALKGFAAIFFTDSYDAAVYAYEPQLRHTFSTPAFYYHGYRLCALGTWQPTPSLTFSARCGLRHFFNCDATGTGADKIEGKSRAELALQVVYTGHLF